MLHLISKFLWWRKSPKQLADEEYLEGWEGIPESESARKKMSPPQLAIRLSKCKKDSPAYILVEHELNRRIAHVQALPAYLSLITAIVGIFLGWGLAQWKPFQSKTCLDIMAEHIKKYDAAHPDYGRNNEIDAVVQPGPTGHNNSLKPANKPGGK
jgi:hypothetical protein